MNNNSNENLNIKENESLSSFKVLEENEHKR